MTGVILEVDENSWLMAKKMCFFYGEYDARNIGPEKSRDLGSLGHFSINF